MGWQVEISYFKEINVILFGRILYLSFLFIPEVANAAIPSSEHQTFHFKSSKNSFCAFLETVLRIFSVKFSLGLVWCLPGADFSLAGLVRFINFDLPTRVAFAYRSNLSNTL